MRTVADRNGEGAPLWVPITVAGTAVIAFVLGFIGMAQLDPANARITDWLYWTLQLFLLDSAPLQNPVDPPVVLEIARFLAPATTTVALLATVKSVLDQVDTARRVRGLQNHTVVVGAGLAALVVARSVAEEGRDCVLVEPGMDKGRFSRDRRLAPPIRRRVVARMHGDARDREVLAAAGADRAQEIVVLGEDDARNVDVAMSARSLVALGAASVADTDGERPRSARPRAPLCIVELRRPSIATALAAHEISAPAAVRVEYVDPAVRAARELLGDYLIGTEATVAVIGSGRLHTEVVAEVNRRLDSGRCESGTNTGVLDGETPDAVFVCADDDASAIVLGLDAHRMVGPRAIDVVVATTSSTSLGEEVALPASAAANVRVVWVNMTNRVYAISSLRNGFYADVARAAHATYLHEQKAQGVTRTSNPSVVPWAELTEDLRASNYAQAFDIGSKLRALNCAVVPVSGPTVDTFEYRDSEVERLAKMEHSRWWGDRLAAGWTLGPTKDPDRKRSPYLVPWSQLDAVEAEVGESGPSIKDRDRTAITAIPDLLEMAGLRILRI